MKYSIPITVIISILILGGCSINIKPPEFNMPPMNQGQVTSANNDEKNNQTKNNTNIQPEQFFQAFLGQVQNISNQKHQQPTNKEAQISENFDDDLVKELELVPKALEDNTKWLFVVGIEDYKYTDNIVYAKRSAEMFAKTVQKTRGVPAQNTYALINQNATTSEIKTKLKLMLRNVKEGDSIYFYYNGHGVPAIDKENEPFILANDMMPDFITDEPQFMMKQIYKELSDSKAGSVIAVIDSCFSGSTDGKSIQKGVAATRVKPKEIDFDKTKMVVLTAGKGTQYSNAYNQKSHRMFSYFVIEELLKGDRNLKELYGNVYKNTKEITRANYGDIRIQEPTMDGNSEINF